jgi:hypothetical protein
MDTPLEPEESRPKVKRIGYLGDSGVCPSSSLLGCALLFRVFIIKYNLGGYTIISPLAKTAFLLSLSMIKHTQSFLLLPQLHFVELVHD